MRLNAVNSLKNKKIREKYLLLLMAAPFTLVVFLFGYLPLHGWIYAFFDYKPGIPLSATEFVGFKNFSESIIFDSYIISVLRNTLVLSFLGILSMPVPVLFAIILSELGSSKFKKLVQTTSTLPYYISWITVFALAYAMFSNEGLIKQILSGMGFENIEINILGNANIAWFFQILLNLWKNTGYSAILYFAAIAAIDTEQYYAAKVDGAGRLSTILYITLPGISSTFFVLLLLTTANILSNGFDQYFVFYNPMVADKLEVLDYYVYVVGLYRNMDVPYATAVGIYKTVISLILLFACNGLAKKVRGQSLF